MKRTLLFSVILASVTGCVILACKFPVCRKISMVCENTASRHCYSKWCWGGVSTENYQQSPIEIFIKSKNPLWSNHEFFVYNDIGVNLFGKILVHCNHGSPPNSFFFSSNSCYEEMNQFNDSEKDLMFTLFSDRQTNVSTIMEHYLNAVNRNRQKSNLQANGKEDACVPK